MITSYLNRLALLYSFRMVFHPYSKQAISRLVNMFELVSIVVEADTINISTLFYKRPVISFIR